MRLRGWYVLVLFSTLAFVIAAEPVCGRPMLYNYISDVRAEGERILQETYGPRYTIVPAAKASGLVPPKLTLETYPLYGRVPGGPGKVIVAFVVGANGRVKDPVIVYSTQPRNDRMVREMVSKWLWKPAQLNGAPVPSIVSHRIGFSRVTRQIGYGRPPKEEKK